LTSLSLHTHITWLSGCKWQASLLKEGLLWSTPEGAAAYVNVLFEDN